jgi:ligand-binding SRPBCC domain-containing protein
LLHTLEFEQWVAAPVQQVFRFFADPRNLPVISPPSSGATLKALRLITPGNEVDGGERLAGVGSEIEISFRFVPYLPFRRAWTARIVAFEWLRSFRDVQISGPFRRFEHTHEFSAEERNGRSGTVIRDHLQYEVGFGLLGEVANTVAIRRVWQQMFEWRHRAAEQRFSA